MRTLPLRVHLWLLRVGCAIPATIAALTLGIATAILGIPAAQSARDSAQRRLAEARSAPSPATNRSFAREALTDQKLATFYTTLGRYQSVEDYLGTLFQSARNLGLTLKQGEYHMNVNAAGSFYTYRVVLPVHGPYRAIRQFCDQVLADLPFTALDEIQLKRGAISDSAIEARLQFTLFLSDGTVAGSSASAPEPTDVSGP